MNKDFKNKIILIGAGAVARTMLAHTLKAKAEDLIFVDDVAAARKEIDPEKFKIKAETIPFANAVVETKPLPDQKNYITGKKLPRKKKKK